MRLQPIEKPKSLFIKIAFWFTKRQYGKVMSPLKVIYARKPELLNFAMKIAKFEEKQNTLSSEMRLLIKVATATQNGCTFCQDIALAHAVKGKIGTEKFTALINRDETKMQIFSEKERAVLQVLDEYNINRKVSDEAFDQLRKYFDETQIVEILALNAFEQFYNAMTIPLEIESDGLAKLAEQN